MLVPSKVFALHEIGDNESSRYALGGIHFERDEHGVACAVATDGRMLASLYWPEDKAEDYPATKLSTARVNGVAFTLPTADCKDAAKLPPKRSPKPILANVLIDENVNGKVHYGATDLEKERTISATLSEGQFPRWRDVIGTNDKPVITEFEREENEQIATRGQYATIHINPDYLAALCNVAKKTACDDESCGIDILVPIGDTGSPLHIQKIRTDGTKFHAVLMPITKDR